MAKPIEFKPTQQGARERIEQRLRDAPVEHAEAMLATYDLLQELHDSGTLALLRGMLGAGDKIVEEVSAMLVQPETIRGIGNFIVLSRIMASISPEALERIAKALPQTDAPEQVDQKPPSLFSLARRLFSVDSRRGLALGLTAAEALGQGTRSRSKV
jgi:uncharacterized protein YjgD (DUF1641 family)